MGSLYFQISNFDIYLWLMQKNKKLFLILFVIFMLIMGWIGYDISQRTTFPGSKGNLKERITTGEEEKK